MVNILTGEKGSAVFSDDSLFRYELRRKWSDGWLFGAAMHNPSKASHETNDPTITRLIGFARREGAGGLVVVNVSAYSATDPDELLSATDPVGPENERFVLAAAREVKIFLVAWGAMAKPIWMKTWAIRRVLMSARSDLVCLGETQDRQPRHPLYVRADKELEPWP